MTLKVEDACPRCHNKSLENMIGSKENPLPVENTECFTIRCNICENFFIIEAHTDKIVDSGR